MLAQADGICREVFRALLFMKKDRERLQAELANLLKYGSATDVLFGFLYRETVLNERTATRDKKRKKDPQHGPFNRHGVLHGLDLDYATQPNSFRAIVILGYLQVMQMFYEGHKKVEQEIGAICEARGVTFPRISN